MLTFTSPFLRKKGYASALVAELCLILGQNGLVPKLYADLKNPDSNKIYKNIGFVEAGKIADIRFHDYYKWRSKHGASTQMGQRLLPNVHLL
ncbi:GNAT family N-acetyltransferase [Paenibacillus alkalitolerans]|uniref:GNAT family N-acetyltransferase n=1 Tax=Paenibacillus alkalitolerans TaxID=2799335 RepID=UPI0018F28585|nr:GNAT family N-acetyltransferase [Paenibacillus alkalitolerans]